MLLRRWLVARIYGTDDDVTAEVALAFDDCEHLLRIRLAPVVTTWLRDGRRLNVNTPLELVAPKLMLN